MGKDREVLVQVEGLKKYFWLKNNQILQAVDGVTFDIFPGETLGLVGESGCGKTTLGRTMMRLYQPTAGDVLFKGESIFSGKLMQPKMRKEMQMIFQNPYGSLNPRMTVGDIIGEAIDIHSLFRGKIRRERIQELLSEVGLLPEDINRFPHEFSGGQCQRIGIARSLAVEPNFIICDEPISALDLSIQAQMVNLLEDLQQKFGLTYLFIAHDLSMVKHISNRVAVMYLGKIVEMGECHELFQHFAHPYTQALLSAIPIPDPQVEQKRKRVILEGGIPNPVHLLSGCRFRTRCPRVKNMCREIEPTLKEIQSNHQVACHFPGDQKYKAG